MPRGIPNKRLEFQEHDDPAAATEIQNDTIGQEAILDDEPEPVATRPLPDSELTPDQLRIRDLENQLALERGKRDVEPEYEPIEPNADGNIVIHIVGEGFTALGQQWYVGQELEFDPKGRAYKDTFDRRGQTWLRLATNEMAQVEKYGKVLFRAGPWPGKDYAAAAGSELQFPLKSMSADGKVYPPTQDELHAAARRESARARRAPRIPDPTSR